MPPWVRLRDVDTLEGMAFVSGAGLAHLHGVLQMPGLPDALLRDRLALRAAENCVAFSGRPERLGDLRDAVHLLRPGDHPGPAGEICQQWRKATARPLSVASLGRALPHMTAEQIAVWLDAGQGSPPDRAARVLQTVLAAAPRAEAEALILADVALAQALRWTYAVPLIGTAVKPRDLRKTGDELRWACHRALVVSSCDATRQAADLTRRAQRLMSVAPKLRAKGAAQAVKVFLTQDAVAPAGLQSLMSARAARRLCDRLVALGVVRELTGRATFRFYGV
ncbi:DUF1403 family protein [Rhodobacteraceae bacterium F11138]|nr:DUF1403 family protein [Rhodobacteraceae bacterium F11138]